MQIFPNVQQMTGVDSLFSTGSKSSNTSSFTDFLKLAQNAMQNEEEYSPSDPLNEAPYSSNTSTGLFSFDEVGFTKSELFELHQKLIKAGANSEDLDQLRTLLDKPDGANISQIIKSLSPENEVIQLSESEQLALSSFLTKIDSTGELENSVNSLLDNGQGLAAWSMISQKLSGMDQGQDINVDKDEMAVLGKALGLSEKGQTQLLSGFGSFTSFELSPSNLQKLLSPAQTDLAESDLNKDKLQKALETTLGPILQKANDRWQAEKDAASLESKTVQYSDILIKETVTEDARGNLEQTATGAQDTSKQNNSDKNVQTIKGDNKQNPNGQNTQNPNGQALANENAKNAQTQANPNGQALANENGQNTQNPNGQALASENAKNAQVQANPNGQALASDTTQISTTENPLLVNQVLENNTKEPVNNQKNDFNNANITNANNVRDIASENSADTNSNNNPSNNKDTNWDSLLGKVEVQQSSTKSETSFSSLTGLQSTNNAHLAENVAHDISKATPAPRYSESNMASQVEKGLLSAMKNGTTKLELQLNPGDLGTITLILTSSSSGEISASIRSDRTETAEVMQRQLDVIRVNLEQQGIKVDKLDVQYESSEKGQGEAWKDLQQHNNQQEQNARQEQLERLRNLRSVRNSGTNSHNKTLERDMHIPSTTANNSTTSLHVVA